ncbi:LVIVD repeat-containing protein [Mangrovibacterium sp.]|uniref:LVIVD repeat-containing protein n=1 Tax=Mangrovibacterium sp. TaxID=1961364 RepID=UPI00356820D5
MKKRVLYIFLFMGLLALSGCEDKIYESYLANSPVYMSYDDLRSAVKTESPRELKNPGKIYFKDNYIFINEQTEGVHVLNVQDPANPEEIAFLSIPGNIDLAIKDDVLYADSYVDLVAIDLSDLSNMHEVGRVEDIFPYTLPEYDTDYRLDEIEEEKGVVLAWEIKEVRHRVEQQTYPIYYYDTYREALSSDFANYSSAGVGGGSGSTFGVGGSMARFGLNGDFLYVVDDYQLYTIKINDLENPVMFGTKTAGWGIETMFVYDDHLFLGTTTGMLIYSLELPESPTFIKQYTHITSCDPVVVQNDLAYVTLRDGGWCGQSVNRLDVIRMSDNYTELTEVATYPMVNPHGLGIDGDILFVCDGDAGLKVYDVADPESITQHKLASFPDIQATDVIPVGNYLFMIGEEGFYLYDYSSLQDIHLLSHIPVVGDEI